MSAYDDIFAMVEGWRDSTIERDRSGRLKRILENLRYLERVKFQPFVPTLYSHHPVSFMDRFHAWLTNPGLSVEQQRDLFEFANYIAFFSFDDFTALFQSAFSGPITRWCMNQTGFRLDAADWQAKLNVERYQGTWFCPVTDSLLISVFHHVNGIEGKDRKPSFRDLAEFGDPKRVLAHIRENGYKRLVLLEDFVGTGTQSFKAIKWAVKNLDVPVLFCPIVVATEALLGHNKIRKKLADGEIADAVCPSFSIEPIFTLGRDCFVYDLSREPDALLQRVRQLAEEIHEKLKVSSQECKEGALGWWKEESTQKGAMAVIFSNTPNNTLPLIHHEAQDWRPLFPRVARQPL